MRHMTRLVSSCAALAFAASAHAQTSPDADPSDADVQASSGATEEGGLTDIVVTARKRSQGELAQDVPIAITAVSGEQLRERNIVNLTQLAESVPNVAMDEISSLRGTANFSIRGLGANSTLPTLESATGTFIDGIYLANNQGVILDLFDLDGIEILRGPQGTLFGKNVTGGAVLIRTGRPTRNFEARGRIAVQTGPEVITAASISGPISSTLSARASVYYQYDDGWFTNLRDNTSFGEHNTKMGRVSLLWEPTSSFNALIRYEQGGVDGEGNPTQNRAFYDRHTFDFSQDTLTPNDLDWTMVSSEINLDIGPGTLTNIGGYRYMRNRVNSEVEGTPLPGFNQFFDILVKQYSNELRYAFDVGPLNLTTGLYYFNSDISSIETRRILPLNFAPRTFGGFQRQDTYAAFAQGDYEITDALTVTLGGRYSIDKKGADIAFFSGAGSVCDEPTRTCTFNITNATDTYKTFSPRAGLQLKLGDDAQVYASAARAYRAGGFNIRITNPNQNFRFGQEQTTAFEVGGKADFLDNKLRTNLAVFVNKIDNMIRDVNFNVGPVLVQDTQNGADGEIWGVEFEALAAISRHFQVNAFAGYQHARYTAVTADLNGDLTVNATDLALKPPRLAPWSFGGGFNYSRDLSDSIRLIARASYSHRDEAFSDDANFFRLNEINNIDGSIGVELDNHLTFNVYVKNALNRPYQGIVVGIPQAVTPVPIPAGRRGTFSGMSEGRTIGAELQFNF